MIVGGKAKVPNPNTCTQILITNAMPIMYVSTEIFEIAVRISHATQPRRRAISLIVLNKGFKSVGMFSGLKKRVRTAQN